MSFPVRIFRWLILLAALTSSPAQTLTLSVVRQEKNPQAFDVVIENLSDKPIAVVGAKTRKDSHEAMTVTLLSRYKSIRTSQVIAPYLVIEALFSAGERVVMILPPELAKPESAWVAARKETFAFQPGESFYCAALFIRPPAEVTVRYIDGKDRSRMVPLRWRPGARTTNPSR